MNYPYVFKYRRRYLWKKAKVVGHAYDSNQNKMQLFYEDGAIQEVKAWDECEVILSTDWVLATKRKLEDQTGQSIKLAVKE